MGNEKEKKKLSIKEIGPSNLIIIFLVGVFLLVLSFRDLRSSSENSKDNTTSSNYNLNKVDNSNQNANNTDDTYLASLEKRLEGVLGKVEGIGSVEVMITLKGSKELVTLKDSPYTQESVNEVDGEGGSRLSSSIDKDDSTVIVNSGNGESMPYIIKEIEPEVAGVVVIAQGGDSGVIKTEITEAVQVLFNIPVHKIKVMKMN
jgi:stage III sporulation protein AG